MEIAPLLHVTRGVTALIGGGGKTMLLYTLAEELHRRGTVIVTTSTHIQRPEQYPVLPEGGKDAVAAALSENGVVCVAGRSPEGKLSAPALSFGALSELADFVLVEADGSKRLPLKAHAPHEPVIPPESGRTILMAGASGFGKPVRAAAHRPGLYARLAGCGADEPVTPEIAARVILAEGLGDEIIVNQSETPEARENARRLAENLPLPVFAGSLRRGEIVCVS